VPGPDPARLGMQAMLTVDGDVETGAPTMPPGREFASVSPSGLAGGMVPGMGVPMAGMQPGVMPPPGFPMGMVCAQAGRQSCASSASPRPIT
jgi:hypothetical protein